MLRMLRRGEIQLGKLFLAPNGCLKVHGRGAVRELRRRLHLRCRFVRHTLTVRCRCGCGSVAFGVRTGYPSAHPAEPMAAAAAPYVAWMSATATQAEQPGAQAKAAASAYEAAFAMTVPPPVIAVNRVSWQHWWRLDECCSGLGERIGEPHQPCRIRERSRPLRRYG
jgi:hypothetical protein